jgi:hypothetical protein
MKKLLTGLAISAALLSSVAYSQEDNKMYLEVGYAHTKLESTGLFSENVGIGAVRFGYNFNKNFAGELFLATGLDSANVSGISIKVDSAYGFYLKGKVEVAEGFELFAKPGYVHAKVKASGFGASASSSDDSFSWAVGGQYNFSDRIYGQIDYASYYDKGGDKVSGPSISIGFKF